MAKRKSLPLRTRSSIVTIHEYCDRAKYVTTDSILVKLHMEEIAVREGVSITAVFYSIQSAHKKLKKFINLR